MFDGLTSSIVSALISVINLFPESPIQLGLNALETTAFYDIIRYVNYFIPVGIMLSSLALWLSAVACYYVYQIVLRWVHLID